MFLGKKFQGFEDGSLRIVIVLLAFFGAFLSSKIVGQFTKIHNPDDVLNLYVAGGFSPEQNIVRILWIILGTLALYKFLTYLLDKRPRVFKAVFILFIVFSVFSIDVLPRLSSYTGNLDTFHNGEQLAPASDFNAGKGLFSGMYVLHGAGEDVLVPSFALHTANVVNKGAGISFYYLITAILTLITAAVFIYMLTLLFKPTGVWVLLGIWFTFSVYSDYAYVRDLFTWSIIILMYYVLFRATRFRDRSIALGALGLLSSATLFYAIDRGIAVCIMAGLLALSLTFSERIKSGDFKLRIPKTRQDSLPSGLVLGGALVAQLIGLMVVGVGAYGDFLKTYLVEIPKYSGLMFNYPLPDFSIGSMLIWLPVLLAPFGILMLYRLFRSEKKQILPAQVLLAAILMTSGVLFLRTGYGRPDGGHIAYATPLLFVAIFYAIYLYVQKFHKVNAAMWLPIACVALLFIPVPSLNPNRLALLMNTRSAQIRRFVMLPSIKDVEWEPTHVRRASEYIVANSKADDPLFVYTQQPIYYYLTQRKNPSRFYIPWFADPKPLENELLGSLKHDPPKYIIYSGDKQWDNADGLTMAQRTPSVDAWIKANYLSSKNVDGVLILSRH